MSATPSYDVIVVGARAAGAATVMLAARAGLRVLAVDRGRYGADTLSTHALMRAGVLQLHRWGLLPRVVAAGTPAVRRATFHLPDGQLPLDIKPSHGVDALYAPRRTVLDPALVDAAREAGAEVRFGTRVSRLRHDRSGRVVGVEGRDRLGRSFAAEATVVVGADGRGSLVADRVAARVVQRGTGASAVAYGYWSGVPLEGYHWIFGTGGAAGVIPTNDDLVCVFAGTVAGASPRLGRNGFEPLLRAASAEVAELVLGGTQVGTTWTFGGQPGHLRQAWGPGWALVGDAGYWKDPLSAHGLTDALRDGELLARALVDLLGGTPEAEALGGYQATRDRLSMRLLRVSDRIAGQQWSDDEIGDLLRELASSANDEVEELAALPNEMAHLTSVCGVVNGSFLGDPEATPGIQQVLAGELSRVGYVKNVTRLWTHHDEAGRLLSELLGVAHDAAGLTDRQRAVLVTATASAMGDSYCSLAWGLRLATAAGEDVPASVVRGLDGPLDPTERELARWARLVAADPNGTRSTDIDVLRDLGYDDSQIFAITLFVALRVAFSTVNDALGAVPDFELHAKVPDSLREAVDFGREPAARGA